MSTSSLISVMCYLLTAVITFSPGDEKKNLTVSAFIPKYIFIKLNVLILDFPAHLNPIP